MENNIRAMGNKRKEYRFLWFIENYSYCWHTYGEGISSPKFITCEMEDTVWYLTLYPRGIDKDARGCICFYLSRNREDGGPENIFLTCELSVLAANGLTHYAETFQSTFQKGSGYGISEFLQMDELLSRKSDYLLQDTLSVCCKIWKDDGNCEKIGQSTALTRIGIERVSFVLVVKDFSELKPNETKTFVILFPSDEERNILTSLYLVDGSCCKGKIIVEIVTSDFFFVLAKVKLSLLDGFGNIIECGGADNRFDATKNEIRKLPLSLTRQFILDRKSEYLPNDELSVLCECAFSAGEEFDTVQDFQHALPIAVFKQKNSDSRSKVDYIAAEKISACPNALDDMKTIYNNKCLADVEIKTETKSFPAHKVVLCARSSVFKAMLTNDMKEKNTDCIQVDDLDDDTVQQLLLFLYSDNVENLQWKSAVKLYFAADKYAIEKLKLLCSNFLFKNLNISNAIELLVLTDTCNDSTLKNFADDFILDHEVEVFGSDEWGKVVETNPLLALKTMLLKYKGRK